MNQLVVLKRLEGAALNTLSDFWGDGTPDLYALVDSIVEKKNLFTYILYVFSLHSHSDFHIFLRHLIRVNKLEEEDMISLYRLQPKETRQSGKFINLTLLLDIQESGKNKKWIFGINEFMKLAEEFYEEICMVDIHTIFFRFFYRNSEKFFFEKKFN